MERRPRVRVTEEKVARVAGGRLLSCPLPLRHPDVVGERAAALHHPQLAPELVHPAGVEDTGELAGERRLARRLRPDQHHLLDERRIDARVGPASMAVEVGANARAADRHELARLVDDPVLRPERLGEGRVAGLRREHLVEGAEELELRGIAFAVRGRVVIRIRAVRIRDGDDLLGLRVEVGEPAPALLDRHPSRDRIVERRLVDDDRDVIAFRKREVDQQLVATVKRHELPEDESPTHRRASLPHAPRRTSRRR